jgi:pimeloyl-ACP methyl ester carboxylesterase
VILLDQRAYQPGGPPIARSGDALFPTDRVVTRDEYLRGIERVVREEATRLTARGIPLDALNTNESADDVAALARGLYGEDGRAALLGWSYGSHLAMAVLKRHESLVASAVLAAPEGPDHTYKRPLHIQQHIERIAERVRASASPGAPPFDLVAVLGRVLSRLERDSVAVTIRRGEGDAAHDLVIGRFDLEWIIAEGLADARVLSRLPAWLARMDRGDFSMIGSERLLAVQRAIGRFLQDGSLESERFRAGGFEFDGMSYK